MNKLIEIRRLRIKKDTKILILLISVLLISQNVQSAENIKMTRLVDFNFADSADIAIAGSYAYMATTSGLDIISVASSLNPMLAGTFPFTGTGDLFYSFPYVFICAGTGGMNIINTTTPSAPVSVLGTIFGTSLCIDIEVVGGYAYVADGNSGLLIIDISTIATPVLTATIDVGGYVGSVAINGMTAILGVQNVGGLNGLIAVDISDPTDSTPSMSTLTTTNGAPNGITVQGSYAYVSEWDTGVTAVDVSNAPSSTVKQNGYWNNLTTSGRVYHTFAHGNYLFIAAGIDGLVVLRLINPNALSFSEVGRYDSSSTIKGVWVEKDLVYLSTSTGITLLKWQVAQETISDVATITETNDQTGVSTSTFIETTTVTETKIVTDSKSEAGVPISGIFLLGSLFTTILVLRYIRNKNSI